MGDLTLFAFYIHSVFAVVHSTFAVIHSTFAVIHSVFAYTHSRAIVLYMAKTVFL